MSTLQPLSQILQVTGTITEIGNVRQVNKATIKQSFVLEMHHQFGVEVVKFYCKNELCNLLPYLTDRPTVTVQFKLVGVLTKTANYNNDFEIISITKN